MRLAKVRHLLAFTVVEILVVLAIISALLAIAIPSYMHIINKVKFHEVIVAAIPFKTSMELAVEIYGIESINELNAGKYNILQDVEQHPSEYVGMVTIQNGVITLQNDNMSVSATYQLVVDRIANHQIIWQDITSTQSSCVSLGWC